MTLQTQSKFPELRKSGCYFFSIAFLCGVADLNVIEEKFMIAVNDGCVAPDAFIRRPNEVFSLFGIGVVNTPSYSLTPMGDYNIACWSYNNATHFVAVDKQGKILYDPMGESNSVKYGKIDSFRSFYRLW